MIVTVVAERFFERNVRDQVNALLSADGDALSAGDYTRRATWGAKTDGRRNVCCNDMFAGRQRLAYRAVDDKSRGFRGTRTYVGKRVSGLAPSASECAEGCFG
jgi:hypothetical protein